MSKIQEYFKEVVARESCFKDKSLYSVDRPGRGWHGDIKHGRLLFNECLNNRLDVYFLIMSGMMDDILYFTEYRLPWREVEEKSNGFLVDKDVIDKGFITEWGCTKYDYRRELNKRIREIENL